MLATRIADLRNGATRLTKEAMDKTAVLDQLGKALGNMDPYARNALIGGGLGALAGGVSSYMSDDDDRRPLRSALMGGLAGGALGLGAAAVSGANKGFRQFRDPKTGKMYEMRPDAKPEDIDAASAKMRHFSPGSDPLETAGRATADTAMLPGVGAGLAGAGVTAATLANQRKNYIRDLDLPKLVDGKITNPADVIGQRTITHYNPRIFDPTRLDRRGNVIPQHPSVYDIHHTFEDITRPTAGNTFFHGMSAKNRAIAEELLKTKANVAVRDSLAHRLTNTTGARVHDAAAGWLNRQLNRVLPSGRQLPSTVDTSNMFDRHVVEGTKRSRIGTGGKYGAVVAGSALADIAARKLWNSVKNHAGYDSALDRIATPVK